AHAALGPDRLLGDAAGRRTRGHAPARKAVCAERQRTCATTAAGATHAQGSLRQRRRDARFNTCGISAAARRRAAAARTRSAHRRGITRDGSGPAGGGIRDRRLPARRERFRGLRQRPAQPVRCRRLIPMRIGPYELSSNVVLAPMAGVTDRPFRQLARRFGAGLAASEMITSDVRLWSTKKTRARLNDEGEPEPRVVQLAGADPEALAEAARRNIDLGAQIIDINMGCPAKKV